jgi:hypothetical protein
MKGRRIVLWGCGVFSVFAASFLSGAIWIFPHTCAFSSDRSENCPGDPRWRIFDCNSRQATDNELYTVSDVPSIRDVPEIADRRLRFFFTPEIRTSSWEVRAESTGKTVYRGAYPEIPFTGTVSMDTYRLIPEGVSLPRDISVKVGYAPKELYRKSGLMRPNDYEKYTSELKRMHDLGAVAGCFYREFDSGTGELTDKTAGDADLTPEYFKGDVAFGYKFGYGNSKSLSKVRNFIRHNTLVYAPFEIPKLCRIKYACLWGFPICLALTAVCGLVFLANNPQKKRNE